MASIVQLMVGEGLTGQGQDISGACGQLVVEHDAAKKAAKSADSGSNVDGSGGGGDTGRGDEPALQVTTGSAQPVADIEEVGGSSGRMRTPLAALKALFV